LYNRISAVQATALEFGMFLLGATAYVMYVVKVKKGRRLQSAQPAGDDFSLVGKN
jgi:hypothetical protein